MSPSAPLRLAGVRPWPAERAEAYRRAGHWRGETLGAWLDRLATAHPARVALVDARRRLTYDALARESRRLAAGLSALGLRRGDRVVLQLPNRIELFEVLFALARLGVAPVLALPAHRRHELSQFANIAQARALIAIHRHLGFDFRELAHEVARTSPSVEHVVVLDSDGETGFDALRRDESFAAGPHAADVALFQLSGGSTGTPKLIPRTHDDYLCGVRASAEICGWSAQTIYLAALPAQHNFPLSSPGVLGALDRGGRAILCQRPTPDEAFAWIEREAVTWSAVVPPLLRVWLEARRRSTRDLTSLEVLQVGGAPLSEALARRVPELGCRLQQVFGMAEGLVCYTRLDDPATLVAGSQGRPISADDEILLVDDGDRPVPDGEAGHLLARGPYTIVGYYRDELAHAEHFTADGFYRTGDRARRLASGHLVVVGRAKDQINRGGDKVSAPEVEAQLALHPAVAEVALVPLADPYLGERSCAVIVPIGEPPAAAELRAFLRARGLSDYKLPDRVEFLPQLPRTAVGKVDKLALRQTLIAPEETAP